MRCWIASAAAPLSTNSLLTKNLTRPLSRPRKRALSFSALANRWAFRYSQSGSAAFSHFDGTLAASLNRRDRRFIFSNAEGLIGKTLDFMLPASDPSAREFLASIVRLQDQKVRRSS